MIYIARDKDDKLFLYTQKPNRNTEKENFMPNGGDYMIIDSQYFTEVTYENSPQEVNFNIKIPETKETTATDSKEGISNHFEVGTYVKFQETDTIFKINVLGKITGSNGSYAKIDNLVGTDFEKSASEFITIYHFEDSLLSPTQYVLVRNSTYGVWNLLMFSHKAEAYWAGGIEWKYCIPFNRETMHLRGTTKEEPEFYKIG